MNRSMILYILGCVLKIEGALMLLPCLVAVIYRETCGLTILLAAAIAFTVGSVITIRKPKSTVFYLKEGCLATSLSWIVMSLFGCIPFYISGTIPSFTDALFETVSGFTTTGASILTEVESLPRCMLFWRSFTHWIGGMGVLVFLLAIIPMSGGSNMNLMRAESPGPSVGKLVPKMKQTAQLLYFIYMGLTVAEIVLLLLGGMPIFDSLTITFGSVGTGGFGVRNDSIASYSPYCQWIVILFMTMCGINFNAYYYILYHKWKKAFGMEEVRYYLSVILSAIVLIMFLVYDPELTFFHNLRNVTFQVTSLMTSTGYATVDFDLWPQTARTILILIMFVGACAGSTGGGIKVSRVLLMAKTVKKELNSYLHPKSVRKIKIEGKPVEHDVVRSVNVFFIAFVMVFAFSWLLLSLEGRDMVTNFTAVLTCMNNMGPGLEQVGPSQNFSMLTRLSKFVLMFDMLAGRLELFPMLLLIHPSVWKQMFRRRQSSL